MAARPVPRARRRRRVGRRGRVSSPLPLPLLLPLLLPARPPPAHIMSHQGLLTGSVRGQRCCLRSLSPLPDHHPFAATPPRRTSLLTRFSLSLCESGTGRDVGGQAGPPSKAAAACWSTWQSELTPPPPPPPPPPSPRPPAARPHHVTSRALDRVRERATVLPPLSLSPPRPPSLCRHTAAPHLPSHSLLPLSL